MPRARFVGAVLSCLLATISARAAEVETGKPVAGGGLLSPDEKVAYLPNPAGGIDAVEVTSGKELWTIKDAAKLLATTADRVFVQAPAKGKNGVVVKAFDTTGKLVKESDPIAFPGWVVTSPTYGRTFKSAARVEKGAVDYVWQANAFYAGGAPPPPEILKAANKSAAGSVRVDLETGKVELLKDTDLKPAFPADVLKSSANGVEFSIEDKPGKNPFQKLRLLKAAGKDVSWQRQILAPVSLPPLP
jgi:hypothetical protein